MWCLSFQIEIEHIDIWHFAFILKCCFIVLWFAIIVCRWFLGQTIFLQTIARMQASNEDHSQEEISSDELYLYVDMYSVGLPATRVIHRCFAKVMASHAHSTAHIRTYSFHPSEPWKTIWIYMYICLEIKMKV